MLETNEKAAGQAERGKYSKTIKTYNKSAEWPEQLQLFPHSFVPSR
jgi:hypothetical protein